MKRFASRESWRTWLETNHERSPGSQALSVDQKRYRQRFTPRRARSKWSKINCAALVPPDFEAMLAKGSRARRAFENLDGQNRYAIL